MRNAVKLYFSAGKVLFINDKLRQCCCQGLFVESVQFDLAPDSDPCCLTQMEGELLEDCYGYALSEEGALLLAVDYLEAAKYTSRGNRGIVSEERCPDGCGVCTGSIFRYLLTGSEYDATSKKYVFTFDVEDCANEAIPGGIPPIDYICTVTVRGCYADTI